MERPLSPPFEPRWPLYVGLTVTAAAVLGFAVWPGSKTGTPVVLPGSVAGPNVAEINETTPTSGADETELPADPKAEARLKRTFQQPSNNELLPRILRPDEVKPAPKRLADAFEAATGHRQAYGVTWNGHPGVVSPLKIIQLPFGPALITRLHFERACGRCAGVTGTYYLRERIGVYYLKERGGKLAVKGRWPEAVEGSDWTDSPIDWDVTNRFTAYPAIFATMLTSYKEGILHDGVSLTELRPSGPVESDPIITLYSSDGRQSADTPVCITRGRITNIRKDRSFDLVVTGSKKGRVDHFVKRNGKFEIVGDSTMWHMPCGLR